MTFTTPRRPPATAPKTGLAFSLSETYWNVRLAEVDPGRTARLAPNRVAPWLRRAAIGDLPGSGRPTIGQISYATAIARRLRIPLDAQAVGRALDGLRSGPTYRPTGEAKSGDWGSTALAMRSFADLGRPAPQDVLTAARDRVASYPPAVTYEMVVLDLASLLEVVTLAATPPAVTQQMRSRYDAALATLDAGPPDAVGLATRHQLSEVGRRLGRSPRPASRLCMSSRAAQVDLQTRYVALSLGCPGATVPARVPYSRAGWPTDSTPVDALAPTVAGARIAAALGVLARHSAHLSTTLDTIWLPIARTRSPADPLGATTAGRVLHLTAILGRPVPADLLRAATSGQAAEGLPMLTGLSVTRGHDATRATVTRSLLAAVPIDSNEHILAAAMLELGSRILDDPSLHARAVAALEAYRLAPEVFAANSTREPSLSASALGSWILRGPTSPMTAWIDAGLCSPDGRCAETPTDARSTSLRIAALLLACHMPACGEDFPLSL